MIKALHDSHTTAYRQPFGALTVGGSLRLVLDVWGENTEEGAWVTEALLRLWYDTPPAGAPQERLLTMQSLPLPDGGRRFSAGLTNPEDTSACGLIWYYFMLRLADGRLLFYGNNPEQLGGVGQLYPQQPPAYQVTLWQPLPAQQQPRWFSDSICYQIFPDRFCRGEDWQRCQERAKQPDDWQGPRRFVQQNWHDRPFYSYNSKGEVTRWGFFGGNLEGIRSRLLYLKSLGVSAIYLNPIFLASSNHKYDTADYLHLDPSFGEEADFRRLAAEARRLNISLILDGVFSHTGDDSRYFNKQGNFADIGAYQSRQSPYFDWYKFNDFPDDYKSWWGVGSLPEVQEDNPGYRQFIYGAKNSVVRRWLRLGARGWRLDVADELPDSFIAGLTAAAKAEKPDALVLGEVWEDASNKESYGEKRRYLLGQELDGVMNYPFRTGCLDFLLGRCSAKQLAQRLLSQLENYPAAALANNLNLIGTHDTMRALTCLGEAPAIDTSTPAGRLQAEEYALPPQQRQLAGQRLQLLALLQFTMLGVPCIYYGDEAGVEGYADPFNRAPYPWGREDAALLDWYRRLTHLRQEYHLLREGDFRPLALAPEVYGCRRFWPKGQAAQQEDIEMLTLCNRAAEPASLQLPLPEGTVWALELLSGREISGLAGQHSLLQSLPPLTGQVWLFRRQAPAPNWAEGERAAGILCPISSLPADQHEGGWPAAARRFVDYLAMAGQKLWQLLPLHPVDNSNSPYTPYSVFAAQEQLAAQLLAACPWPQLTPQEQQEYADFCQEQADWLEDYALFAAISAARPGVCWQDWPQAERERQDLPELCKLYAEGMEECRRRQFLFRREWRSLRAYANGKGVRLIGDLPIYAAPCGADTWAHPELFLLNEAGWPLAGAGVPPDYFAQEGQNWGHPLYDWQRQQADGFSWWRRRFQLAMADFDYIRLDHFRSFSAFYAIPAGCPARQGYWLKGPGREFFAQLTAQLGPLPLIAEDLGQLDQEVGNLLRLCGYPGMTVYQFEPAKVTEAAPDLTGRALYSGTHDNQTLCGWLQAQGEAKPQEQAQQILGQLYASAAPLVIVPLQDILGLGDEARLNVPGQPQGNWLWQAEWQQFKITQAAELAQLMQATGRSS